MFFLNEIHILGKILSIKQRKMERPVIEFVIETGRMYKHRNIGAIVRLVAFDEVAERMIEYNVCTGMQILVNGHFHTTKDGNGRYNTEVVAQEISLDI